MNIPLKRISTWLLCLMIAGCSVRQAGTNQDNNADNSVLEERLASKVEKFLAQNEFNGSASLRAKSNFPVIAATKKEMARLKTAWSSKGPEHAVLADRFARADKAIADGLYFPPEGGQHNQWYQCDDCQRSLTTIDAHHHRCPSCNKIYSGFPYDNVLYNRQHRLNFSNAEDAAWAWALTGEKKYADFAAAILTGYAERYLNYPMVSASVNDKSIDIAAGKNTKYKSAGHMQPQTLDESMSMIPAVVAYDLIYDSPSLTEKQKQEIEGKFIRAMAESINVHKTGKSNWQTWHNAALLYAGAVLGDGSMIRQALLDEKNGFTTQMKISVMPEGMWYENSWGYHYYTLSAMTHIAEGARRLGIDIYSFPPLRNMYFIAFDYLMADGSLPRFGDAVQDSPRREVINEKAYAVYKDDRLLATLPSQTSWDAIVSGRNITKKSTMLPTGSKLIPGAGHAILATDGPGRLTAAMAFGPYGGFHGHFDKLSFMFFGFGQELGVDPGRAASQAYRLPIHREWYKSSVSHNVVLADGKSQKEAGGKHLAFQATNSYAAVTADAGPIFDNISHVRFMLLAPSYLMIIDELKSDDGAEHVYDWLYHNKGQSVAFDLPLSEIQLDADQPGFSYLRDVKAHVSNEGSIEAKFMHDGIQVFLNMDGEPGDQIFTATGPFTNMEDRVPMVVIRRKGKSARFIAVLEPVRNGSKREIIGLESQSGLFGAVIKHNNGKDIIEFGDERLDKFLVRQETRSVSKIILNNQ